MARTWDEQSVSELMRSYQGTCVLLAGAELGVYDALAHAPCDSAALATELRCDARGMRILLDAMGAAGLLVKEDGRYGLADGVAATLTGEGARSLLAMARHQANCLRHWAELARVVQSGRPEQGGPSLRGEAADYAAFIEAMDNASRDVAPRLIGELPEMRFTRLLDVGGASGTWTIAWLKRYPAARALLFDLSWVIPQAEARLSASGVRDRVELVAGDFLVDELPAGADLAWVSAIIHQMSREHNRTLFGKLARALAPGGQVLIRDVVMDPNRTGPPAGAMFAVNMLVNTRTGDTFTFEEIRQDLESAGFGLVRQLRTDAAMNSIVRAVKGA